MSKNKVGCCAITWMFRPGNPIGDEERIAMVPRVLAEIREAGYAGVELGVHVEDLGGVEGVRGLMDEAGLEVIRIGSKAPLREGAPKMKELGAACLMVGTPARKQFPGGKPPADAFKKVSQELEEKAKISLEEFGLPTALHNHLWTMAESREEVDRLFEGTRHLRLLLDIAHLKGAGDEPIDAIRDYGEKIVDVHVKDWDSTLYSEQPFHPGFVELGRGDCGLDIAGCLDALQQVGYAGWLTVEHDTSDTPLESNRHNREYLKELGY
jgi:sugar phosphate isomerase/epimerase